MSLHPNPPSDDELLSRARAGDDRAYATLWERHAPAAQRLARQFHGDWDADDLVAEAYTRVFDLLRRGRGPVDGFRPYLFAVVRSVAQAWSRKVAQPFDDFDSLPDPDTEHDPAIRDLESSLTRKAFLALPERQRSVLWYTEVEGMTPQQISPLLGMTPNSVSALAYRSREALRTAWIQAHLHEAAVSGACEWTLARLGDYTRNRLTTRHRQRADAHLANCASCARARAELHDVGSSLAIAILAPIVGVGAGMGYLASSSAPPAAAATATAGVAGVMGAAAPTAGGLVGNAVLTGVTTLVLAAAVTVSSVLPPMISDAAEDPGPAVVVSAPAQEDRGSQAPAPATSDDPLAPPSASRPSPPSTVPPADDAAPEDPAEPPRDSEPEPGDGPQTPEDPAEQPQQPEDPAEDPDDPAEPVHTLVVDPIAENDVRPTFSGTGLPGATIALTHVDGAPIATAVVADDGRWSIPPQTQLTPAVSGFRVIQSDPDGVVLDELELGPYEFRLETNPTVGEGNECVSHGVRGWQGAEVQIRVQTASGTTTQFGMIGQNGVLKVLGTVDEPTSVTYRYTANPDAPPVVHHLCGW